MDELRYSRNDSTSLGSLMSPGSNGNRLSQSSAQHDPRRNLPRRFTTESASAASTHSSPNAMANAPRAADPSSELSNQQRVLLLEKKKKDYENIITQRRKFEMEMAALEQAQLREEQELVQLQKDLGLNSGGGGGGGGHQSEPTTPPEYHQQDASSVNGGGGGGGGFSSFVSRPNRYSTSSIMSPTGMFSTGLPNGNTLSAAHLDALARTRMALDDQLPPQQYDDEDDDDKEIAVRQDPTSHRSTNHLNRYSMPVTRSRTGLYDFISLDQANTARFLFGDDETTPTESHFPSSEDNFSTPGRSDMDRHSSISSANGASVSGASADMTTRSRPSSMYLSSDLGLQDPIGTATPPRLQSGFSTGELPTLNPLGQVRANGPSAINNHAQQFLHHHNASMGRIPAGAMAARHTREMSTDAGMYPQTTRDHAANFGSIGANLQSSSNSGYSGGLAAPTGPSAVSSVPGVGAYTSSASYNPAAQSQSISNMMGSLSISAPGPAASSGYTGSSFMSQSNAAQARESQQQRSMAAARRPQESTDNTRFNGKSVTDFVGRIYDISKDQFGCRFLQRELEQQRPLEVHAIWLETHLHVVELMTDPFGNYLCQKLLEFCNDEDRTRLIEEASHEMVRIALNQHGTRALQKMIEHVSTPEQVALITKALQKHVVPLIQDLNGNHVIQRCLTKLSSDDAAFIFDAVGKYCVVVGCHRHGCCVIQRCIDHAVGEKKKWLIECIISNSMTLVGDAYGNYVIQYILELGDSVFSERMIEHFMDSFIDLSKQKFSSNAMEKALRHSPEHLSDKLVAQMLAPGEIERMLKDPFANYVVQAALEHASPRMKESVVAAVRPLMNVIRHMPYGRRVQARISQYDATRAMAATESMAAHHAHATVAGIPGSHNITTNGSAGNGHVIMLGPNGVDNVTLGSHKVTGYALVPITQGQASSSAAASFVQTHPHAHMQSMLPPAAAASTHALQMHPASMVHNMQAQSVHYQTMQQLSGGVGVGGMHAQYHHQQQQHGQHGSMGHHAGHNHNNHGAHGLGGGGGGGSAHHSMPPLSTQGSRPLPMHHQVGGGGGAAAHYGYGMGHRNGVDDSNWL